MKDEAIADLRAQLSVLEMLVVNLYVTDSLTNGTDHSGLREAFIEQITQHPPGNPTHPETQGALWVEAAYTRHIDRVFGLISRVAAAKSRR